MRTRWTSVAWSVAALLMVLSLFTPLQLITVSFAIVPLVVLYTTLKVRNFAIHAAAIALIAFLLMGAYGSAAILFLCYLMIPAIVIGHLYKRKSQALTVLAAGTCTILLESLVLLFILSTFLDFQLNTFIADSIRASLQIMEASGIQMIEPSPEAIEAVTQLVPFALTVSSLFFASVTHAIGRRILTAMGQPNIPAFKPLKEWMLPKSFVWYYFVAVIINMFLINSESSYFTIILANLIPLLQLAFSVQTVCFFFYVASERKWARAIPYLFILLVYIFPPLRIIGILDIAFPLRQSFVKPKM